MAELLQKIFNGGCLFFTQFNLRNKHMFTTSRSSACPSAVRDCGLA